jgi:predicted MFS family arabinose efflux permease
MTSTLWRSSLALALGAAVSLGLARFAYALLLPFMRTELGWSYFTAGAMNTVNAVGYLIGALCMPMLLRRWPARRLFLLGAVAAVPLLALHGAVRAEGNFYLLRLLLGMASAITFVAGGLLAARLGQQPGARPSLVLGLFYGGVGLGILASALLLPALLQMASRWPLAWAVLAVLALLAALLMHWGTPRSTDWPAPARAGEAVWRWQDFKFGLLGYLLFGLGYIGYMTFNVTLLREQGAGPGLVSAFYALLGLGALASSWLWAPLLARFRGGQPMALLNALLALATLLPVLSSKPAAILLSGALFGAVFLSVVASTTALVRHNLPASRWAAGISAFTAVFAAGQIAGPSLVGWVADGSGGLLRGLAMSAGVLLLGSLCAWGQQPLRHLRP